MNVRGLSLLLLAIGLASFALPAPAAGLAIGSATSGSLTPSETDPLSGKWLILAGEGKERGWYFDGTMAGGCGNADFNGLARRAKFDPPLPPGNPAVPWGEFNYHFDANGMLTLTRPDAPALRCFLKYKEEQPQSIGKETTRLAPYLCVFQDPEHGRAFELFRKGEEVATLARTGEAAARRAVFVPYKQDPLYGAWAVVPAQPAGAGQLEFRFDAAPTSGAAQLVVHADNSVELSQGRAALRFRLRQFDPTHWAIVPLPEAPCTTGTIVLEEEAGGVIGSSVAVTYWQVGNAAMIGVLRIQGSTRAPNVRMIRLPGTQTLNLEALRPPAVRR